MNVVEAASPATRALVCPYRRLSLIQVIERIVHDSDRLAVHELHEFRPVFRYRGDRLRLTEYLDRLYQDPLAREWCGGQKMVLDRAYDLSLDKFSNLPPSGRTKGGGPDCRLYFRAFLRHLARRENDLSKRTPLDRERLAASALQGLVARHFFLSCLECARNSNELIRRVFWRVHERTVCVFMPAGMSAAQCRAWLAANAATFEMARRNGSQRVQSMINERLLLPRVFSWSAFDGTAAGPSATVAPDSGVCDSISRSGLAQAIAEEKTDNIAEQRPAIRRLGKLPLRGLILRIFEDLAGGCYNLGTTAAGFGLSKATLSRFAGTKWSAQTDRGRGPCIPDLWRNTAQTLAGHAEFIDAAKDAGVWQQVQMVLARTTRSTPA